MKIFLFLLCFKAWTASVSEPIELLQHQFGGINTDYEILHLAFSNLFGPSYQQTLAASMKQLANSKQRTALRSSVRKATEEANQTRLDILRENRGPVPVRFRTPIADALWITAALKRWEETFLDAD